MTHSMYYLALPYQGTEEEKTYRSNLSLKLVTDFLERGCSLFAPILYVNQIAESMSFDSLEARRSVIMPYLLSFLKNSKGMVLVTAEGWRNSWGVKEEIKFCIEENIPIFKITPEEKDLNLSHLLSSPLSLEELEVLYIRA